MVSLLVLGACLVVTRFGGDDSSAIQSNMGPLYEQGSAIYTYDDPVCSDLMMKAGSSDTRGFHSSWTVLKKKFGMSFYEDRW